MSRVLTILFRRDPSLDHKNDRASFEGYLPCWPNGTPLGITFGAFCKHGLRLFGLGKHLAGRSEKMIKLLCVPLSSAFLTCAAAKAKTSALQLVAAPWT